MIIQKCLPRKPTSWCATLFLWLFSLIAPVRQGRFTNDHAKDRTKTHPKAKEKSFQQRRKGKMTQKLLFSKNTRFFQVDFVTAAIFFDSKKMDFVRATIFEKIVAVITNPYCRCYAHGLNC